MAKGKLSTEMQLFVVQQLALFEKPTMVMNALKETYGVEVALPAVLYYDITSPNFPEKWRETFEKIRADFLENTATIPIANKAFRLRELDRLYHRNKGSRMENPVEQRATLEQAAKESGDVFTNKHEWKFDVSNATDEELQAITSSKSTG